MSKRFTDTEKYKKPFIRSLKGPYKLLWDYLYHDCDHSGIWIVDFDIAQIYLGSDMPVNEDDALRYFNEGEERVIPFSGSKKWFIPPFIDFQYGSLNPDNRVHKSVINRLKKENLLKTYKGLVSPLEGCKDKDKYKDEDKDKDKDSENSENLDEPKHKPDSMSEVTKFFEQNNSTGENAEEFFYHYSSQNWVKGNGMAVGSWQALAIKWIRKEKTEQFNKRKKEAEKPVPQYLTRRL